jgi:hypothetical protein
MTAAALGAMAAVSIGCGGSGTDQNMDGASGVPYDGGPITQTSGPYQPLVVGATWSYHVDDQGIVYDKQSSVVALEDIGGERAGTMGYKVTENIKQASQLTWYEVTATDVRRHHDVLMDSAGLIASDEWYSPYLLRIDETPGHMQANANWSMTYTNTKTTPTKPTQVINHMEVWKIDGVDVPLSVPAGNFNSIQVTRIDSTDAMTKTQWFVKGVGKVRELTGAGHLEELTSYNVPAQ